MASCATSNSGGGGGGGGLFSELARGCGTWAGDVDIPGLEQVSDVLAGG